MEAKDLQREIVDAERLAERGRIILQLSEQITVQSRDLDAAKKDIVERDETIATLTGELAAMMESHPQESDLSAQLSENKASIASLTAEIAGLTSAALKTPVAPTE